MEDDEQEPRKIYPLSPAKMSKAPSWVMLGFLLGAAFVWGLRRESEKSAPAAPVTLTEWPKAVRVAPSPLTTIEAVFAEWKDHAVWEGGVTEVAMWRSETGGYSEFYEVREIGGEYFFRSIPQLTRRLVRSGTPLPTSAPLQFTESEKHYLEWLGQGRVKRSSEPVVRPRAPEMTPPPKIDASVPALETPRAELPPKP